MAHTKMIVHRRDCSSNLHEESLQKPEIRDAPRFLNKVKEITVGALLKQHHRVLLVDCLVSPISTMSRHQALFFKQLARYMDGCCTRLSLIKSINYVGMKL